MIPTRDQLDRELPRVPAGIPGVNGHLVDSTAFLDWLEDLYRRAVAQACRWCLGTDAVLSHIENGVACVKPCPACDYHRRLRAQACIAAMNGELQPEDSCLCGPESDEQGSGAVQGAPELEIDPWEPILRFVADGIEGGIKNRLDRMPGLVEISELVTPEQARWIKFEWERLHWPPPRKGTHESDLDYHGPYHLSGQPTIVGGAVYHKDDEAADDEAFEFIFARDWSRSA